MRGKKPASTVNVPPKDSAALETIEISDDSDTSAHMLKPPPPHLCEAKVKPKACLTKTSIIQMPSSHELA